MNIIDKFYDPKVLETLSIGEKLQGALFVTLLGISITFIVLLILLAGIKLMALVFKEKPVVTKVVPETKVAQKEIEESITEEEVAAITAAIIAHTNKKNIVISSIREIKSAWKSAAKLEQIK